MTEQPPARTGATSRRRLIRAVAAAGVVTALPGCASQPRGVAVPDALTRRATVTGVPNERFFPFHGAGPLEAEFNAAVERQRRAQGADAYARQPELAVLAISGGGADGAFGAGLLCGWTEQGTRPVFQTVTGISTGALIAPFAYLGTSYDAQLRAVYTETKQPDLIAKRYFTAALFDDAITDNLPLFQTISKYVTEDMLAALAAAYDEGRLLLIGTSNLDAQHPVIWNIGAIARSGHPRALDTIRRVMLASAAIPGAFPPTMIDVTVDGRPFQEMHVDGGTFTQVFLYPTSMTQGRRARMKRGQSVVQVVAYIIRNGRLTPDWQPVERSTVKIAGRAISTMIATSGLNDIVRLYNAAQQDDIGFRLASIGRDFTLVPSEPFEQAYMRALFAYGFEQGRNGYRWATTPPV